MVQQLVIRIIVCLFLFFFTLFLFDVALRSSDIFIDNNFIPSILLFFYPLR